MSNHGVPGSWLFRVGELPFDGSVVQPDFTPAANNQEDHNESCEREGRLQCHSAARCVNKAVGFCCFCNEGYLGNGYNCVKNDFPMRVSGKISGSLGNQSVSSQLQAYIILADGRTYAAISQLPPEIGYSLQLLQALFSPIGWLFARSSEHIPNGYQVILFI